MLENHQIIAGSEKYQRVSNDRRDEEVIVNIKFNYAANDKNVNSCDIRLFNLNEPNEACYALVEAYYCDEYNRIEAHIARHRQHAHGPHDKTINTQGLELGVLDTCEFRYRVTQNNTGTIHPPCDDIAVHPDDKDGSILIGTQ